MEIEPKRQIAGLEILARLSHGGMGEILLARRRTHHGFRKLLAVKTIKRELASHHSVRAMFHDEARLVARLDHPNIAQVYDFGEEEDGGLYLAMEYVHGLPLNRLLAEKAGSLPPMVVAKLVSEVARGLHAAHELTDLQGQHLGVVHRDISPGNLILTFDGKVKILDFGIALMSQRESPDTSVGELKGKPSYMAPEQLRGERVDRRSDIFSLGVVFHELLTGRKLFERSNVVATALEVERGKVHPPSEIADVPTPLDDLVLKALSKNPDDRFQDAKSFAEALESITERGSASSLEGFVEAELHEQKNQHRAWLSGILSDDRVLPERPASTSMASDTSSSVLDWTKTSLSLKSRAKAGLVLLLLVSVSLSLGVGVVAFQSQEPAPIEAPIAPTSKPQPTISRVETPIAPAPRTTGPETEPEPHQTRPKARKPSKKTRRRRKAPNRIQRVQPAKQQTPSAKVVAPVGNGRVTIGASPYARVRIDGVELGPTPIVARKLNAGEHVIELLRPDSGEVRLRKEIDLKADQHIRITAKPES